MPTGDHRAMEELRRAAVCAKASASDVYGFADVLIDLRLSDTDEDAGVVALRV